MNLYVDIAFGELAKVADAPPSGYRLAKSRDVIGMTFKPSQARYLGITPGRFNTTDGVVEIKEVLGKTLKIVGAE
jgi:hypothetical protein